MKAVRTVHDRTEEQQKYVDSIFPKKYKKKEKTLIKIMSRTEYMNNCIYWLNEFYEKKCDNKRAISAANSLKRYCDEIINELK